MFLDSNKALKNELTDSEPSFELLTKREKEVACQISGGHSNKVIARELGIADGTVKLPQHVARL
jgi:two-component system nitrate/nitrite response regulator NarL